MGVDYFLHQRCPALGFAHIQMTISATNAFGGGCALVIQNVGEPNSGAFVDEQFGLVSTLAASSAGDQADFVFKSVHGVPLKLIEGV